MGVQTCVDLDMFIMRYFVWLPVVCVLMVCWLAACGYFVDFDVLIDFIAWGKLWFVFVILI